MKQSKTLSFPEKLTSLRARLEKAYDRQDMKLAMEISRQIDQWQLCLWREALKRIC